MSEIGVYRDEWLDHWRHPRYGQALAEVKPVVVRNRSCGDEVRLYMSQQQGRVAHIGFQTEGCALCVASASMLAEAVQGQTVEEAKQLGLAVRQWFALAKSGQPQASPLLALHEVLEYPGRLNCVELAWQALVEAIE